MLHSRTLRGIWQLAEGCARLSARLCRALVLIVAHSARMRPACLLTRLLSARALYMALDARLRTLLSLLVLITLPYCARHSALNWSVYSQLGLRHRARAMLNTRRSTKGGSHHDLSATLPRTMLEAGPRVACVSAHLRHALMLCRVLGTRLRTARLKSRPSRSLLLCMAPGCQLRSPLDPLTSRLRTMNVSRLPSSRSRPVHGTDLKPACL